MGVCLSKRGRAGDSAHPGASAGPGHEAGSDPEVGRSRVVPVRTLTKEGAQDGPEDGAAGRASGGPSDGITLGTAFSLRKCKRGSGNGSTRGADSVGDFPCTGREEGAEGGRKSGRESGREGGIEGSLCPSASGCSSRCSECPTPARRRQNSLYKFSTFFNEEIGVCSIPRRTLGELRSYKNQPPPTMVYLWASCLLILGYLQVEEADPGADVRGLWKSVQRHLVGRQHAPALPHAPAQPHAPALPQLTLSEALTGESIPLGRLAGCRALQRAREVQGRALDVRRCSPVAEHLDNWVTSILCSAQVQKSMDSS